ncbi:MAG: nucleotide sugar dehydrogenase [Gammaproteobacteria bacterium]|nr:nucleotide sugar dehydrogenase [Gammaproteobacteria bacterium]
MKKINNVRICIIGAGYVGLPLAVAFARKFSVVAIDKDVQRITSLRNFFDQTEEVSEAELKEVMRKSSDNRPGLYLTSDITEAADSDVFVVTVPTPLDEFKSPDLGPLINASLSVGSVMRRNSIVIFESTVYPGCTEEICVPRLEQASGLSFGKDFYCGYSPERINPGDKNKKLKDIPKVTSGSDEVTRRFVDDLYNQIIDAGTHSAPSIKVAEASKVVENCQRDLNISFFNELAVICDRLDMSVYEVIEAASSKWNFVRMVPGLVGGHCIGVDPYYLVHKAQSVGYHPDVILSGRRVNESMPRFIVSKLVRLMIQHDLSIRGKDVLILGLTFKENCHDLRESKSFALAEEFESYKFNVHLHDPWAFPEEVVRESGRTVVASLGRYDIIVLAVAHESFLSMDFPSLLKDDKGIIFDLKNSLKIKNLKVYTL